MKTKSAKPERPSRMSKKRRLEEVQAFADLCLACLPHDAKEVSNMTGLSVSTIYRLRTKPVSLYVRFGTIQALGIAAGFELHMTESHARMVVIN